jgi:hypothetical protein
MNLFLAFVWLLLAALVFARQQLGGDPHWYLPVGGVQVSYGWLALALTAYNLVRWGSLRAARARQREWQLAQGKRAAQGRWDERREPAGPPDPNFVFTDEPPPAPITDKPPPPA